MKNNFEAVYNKKLQVMMDEKMYDSLKRYALKHERTASQIVRKLIAVELETKDSKLFK